MELKKEDISQEVFDLYDDYAHNKMDRKEFLQKLSLYAVGAITLPALLSFISPNYIDSILVDANDPRLNSEFITYDYLKNHKDCTGSVGVVGFCFGGWISNMMAVRIPELGAAVPYYGRQPESEDAAKIKAPLLLQYGELDKRVNEGWPDFETVLKENNIEYTAHFYPNVNHGFHNNTTPRFDKAAADLSWKRTIEFFSGKFANSGVMRRGSIAL